MTTTNRDLMPVRFNLSTLLLGAVVFALMIGWWIDGYRLRRSVSDLKAENKLLGETLDECHRQLPHFTPRE